MTCSHSSTVSRSVHAGTQCKVSLLDLLRAGYVEEGKEVQGRSGEAGMITARGKIQYKGKVKPTHMKPSILRMS